LELAWYLTENRDMVVSTRSRSVDGVRAIELTLIGEIAVRKDGEQVSLPASQKTRALLAYLAVTDKEHRRDRLCSLFWNVPDDPKGALRWSLSKLRHAVDDEAAVRLMADREGVRLHLGEARFDFAALVSAAESADLAVLEAAASIEGDFAPGIELRGCEEFDGWLFAMREDVRQRQIAVRRRLVERLTDEPKRALPHARRLVEVDPLDADGWELLVRLLGECGRSDEAVHQRELAIRTLEAEDIPVPPSLRNAIAAVPAKEQHAPLPQQRVEFCTARDGTGIAYSCVGEGLPLVKTANWLNHLEFEWESPIWRHWIEELTRDRRVVRYDERGNGLSDWKVQDLSFDAFVQDLETVVEASGLGQFDLLGISQGCAVAIAYAVKHPHRLRSLILYGGYSQGWAKRGDPEEIARREAMVTLTRTGWGQDNPAFRQMFTTLYFPKASEEQAQWFNELQRISTSPEGAMRLQRALGQIDVRDLLQQVDVPTLVMHCQDDSVIPFEAGRVLARTIKGARFVALDSPNHLVLESEPAWERLVGTLREFLANPVG
jgi:DNA-binding SARP family transcriptional activator/pimeloyl-ACP methyl ester carboxylesterase